MTRPPAPLLTAATRAAEKGWRVTIEREGVKLVVDAVDAQAVKAVGSDLSNEESECDALFGVNR